MANKTHKWSVTTRMGKDTEDFLVERRLKVSALLDLAPLWFLEKQQLKEDYDKLSRQRDMYMSLSLDKDREISALRKMYGLSKP